MRASVREPRDVRDRRGRGERRQRACGIRKHTAEERGVSAAVQKKRGHIYSSMRTHIQQYADTHTYTPAAEDRGHISRQQKRQ